MLERHLDQALAARALVDADLDYSPRPKAANGHLDATVPKPPRATPYLRSQKVRVLREHPRSGRELAHVGPRFANPPTGALIGTGRVQTQERRLSVERRTFPGRAVSTVPANMAAAVDPGLNLDDRGANARADLRIIQPGSLGTRASRRLRGTRLCQPRVARRDARRKMMRRRFPIFPFSSNALRVRILPEGCRRLARL
jgi:hypothetical protein